MDAVLEQHMTPAPPVMRIDFPAHPVGPWQVTPWWLWLWRPWFRRRHWRWVVDHHGCECTYYWEYRGVVVANDKAT
jgi:hypothetical protein